MEQERPSPQQWPHRPYAELLHADMLPPELANLVIDCMRAYGATTLGVVANVERPHPTGRDILGFISYGYALTLLRLDRIEEYLLFLYSHRFHDHTRGSWTAGEVSGIDGDTATFCIPGAANDSVAGSLDACARGFRRRPPLSGEGHTAGLARFGQGNQD